MRVKGPKQQGKELALRGAACNRQTTPSANMRTNCLDNRRCRLRSNCQIYLHVEWNTFRASTMSKLFFIPNTFISVHRRGVFCNISPVMGHVRKFDFEQVGWPSRSWKASCLKYCRQYFVRNRINRGSPVSELVEIGLHRGQWIVQLSEFAQSIGMCTFCLQDATCEQR